MAKSILLLLVIVIFGAVLRWYRVETLGTFRADQAMELTAARQILQGKLTLVGIKTSISEVRNGAVMYYLLAPFLLLFQNSPLAGAALQSLLSLATVVVIYLIFREFNRPREGIVAAFIVASSPLLVAYSRQTLLAYYPLFFDSLVLFLLAKLIRNFSARLVLIAGFILGFALQIHYSTLAVVFAGVIFPFVFLQKKFWGRYFLTIFAGGTIGFLPMIAFEIRHEFFNTKMALALLQTTGSFQFSQILNLIVFWLETVGRLLFAGNIYLTGIILAVIFGYRLKRRGNLQPLEKLAFLSLGASFILTIFFSKEIKPPYAFVSHYALPGFIPLIILTVSVLPSRPVWLFLFGLIFLAGNFSSYKLLRLEKPEFLPESLMRLTKTPASTGRLEPSAEVLISSPSTPRQARSFQRADYNFFANHGFSMREGWTLTKIARAAEIIKQDNLAEKYNVAMLIDAENQGKPLRYFLDFTPNPPLGIENYAGAKYLYVAVEPGLDLRQVELWELNSFGSKKIGRQWDLENGFILYRLDKEEVKNPSGDKYLTLVYPVRGRNLWRDPSGLKQITDLTAVLEEKKLPATFLLQYDALKDKEIGGKLKVCSGCETGIFLEISENLATDASVSYLIGRGHWARPDMVFFSGYKITERERMADRVFGEFRQAFGYYPKTVGAWYLDPYTLEYVVNKYEVTAAVMVADQYDTDAQRYWGKPWGVPFYPRQFNTLMPASTMENKLDVVELQWAQRHPTDGYGNGVWFSQNSLQANDYRHNSKTTDYFEKILSFYLNNPQNSFGQVTVGLEVGQELTDFAEEHRRQLEILSQMVEKENLRAVTVDDFSDWYRQEFPSLSPVTYISDGTTTWINAPCSRLGLKNGQETFDARAYVLKEVSEDYFFPDKKIFLDREIPLSKGATPSDCQISPDRRKTAIKVLLIRLTETIKDKLAIVKTSVIDGRRIVGVQTDKEAIYGFWSGRGWGNFSFPFQTLVRFQTL